MKTWWKEAVVYQIYPRSFMDSNGDGIGDLNGIKARLPYLTFLGVDILWISPCFKSPNEDNGYDISDYRDIMTEFGTLDDFKSLLEEVHSCGMKLILDLVVNHSSDEHPWFVKGRKSKSNPYHDYYIWQDNQNNWQAHFGGSAWEYNKPTNEYYLHLFTPKQPDLNWENPKLRQEIYDIVNYWLDMGVDGFRMDTVTMYSKAPGFPDTDTPRLPSEYFLDGPRMHEFLQEMHKSCLAHRDVVMIGEAPGISPEKAELYTGENRKEINMLIQFEHTCIDSAGYNKWNTITYEPRKLVDNLAKWQKELKSGWNSQFLSNHNQPRQVSRFGNDKLFWKESAKLLATLIHMLKGTPFIYQGEEIGMTNMDFEVDDYRDVEVLNALKSFDIDDKFMNGIKRMNRDNGRTPMQWDDSSEAGFSMNTPWIKINDNYKKINVRIQLTDQDSIFNYYRKLIELRKAHEVIVYGEFEEIMPGHESLFVFKRILGEKQLFVALNMTDQEVEFKRPKGKSELISNYKSHKKGMLQPYEAIVLL